MTRFRQIAAGGAAAALLFLSACSAPTAAEPSGSVPGTQGPEQTEGPLQALPQEEQDRLLRRIDYALLGQGPYAQRALEGFWIGDADGDGTEELFVQCDSQTGRAIVFAFDPLEDGTPLCYYVADQSASGTSELLLDAANDVPLLYSSSGSGAGEFQQYSRWAGERWEHWAGCGRTVDWEATVDPTEPVFAEFASLDGEEMALDLFRELMDRLRLSPLPTDWEDLFAVIWPHADLDAFAAAFEQHLEQAACDQILPARGDIDGDGEEELVWCVEGISNLWDQNMSYDAAFGAAAVEDQGLFSASRGSDLVIADLTGAGIEIRAGRLSHGAMEGLEIRDGLLCFTYDQGAEIQFRLAGVDPESGQISLEEEVAPEQQYLREGVWYGTGGEKHAAQPRADGVDRSFHGFHLPSDVRPPPRRRGRRRTAGWSARPPGQAGAGVAAV